MHFHNMTTRAIDPGVTYYIPFCKGPIVNHALKLPARCPAVVPEWTTLRWHNTPGRSNSN